MNGLDVELRIEERTEKATIMQRYWQSAMPTAESPMADQFYFWSRQHELDCMLFAIDKTARKRLALNGRMDVDHMVRYASKVANNFDCKKGESR